MDLQKLLKYRNQHNRFCRRLGIEVTEVSPGHAKVTKTVTEEDLNPFGYTHGGIYFTMADHAAGSALVAYGHKAVTLDAQYHFFRSSLAGDVLTAEATELKHGETVSVFEVTITDQNGVRVGAGTFTFFDLKEPLTVE